VSTAHDTYSRTSIVTRRTIERERWGKRSLQLANRSLSHEARDALADMRDGEGEGGYQCERQSWSSLHSIPWYFDMPSSSMPRTRDNRALTHRCHVRSSTATQVAFDLSISIYKDVCGSSLPSPRPSLPYSTLTSVPQLPHSWRLKMAAGCEDRRHPTMLASIRRSDDASELRRSDFLQCAPVR
jgi:hypothetical protein